MLAARTCGNDAGAPYRHPDGEHACVHSVQYLAQCSVQRSGTACCDTAYCDAGPRVRDPRPRAYLPYSASTMARISRAVSDGVLPTFTPAASRASFLACAVPDEPDTIAPAWPMVLPSGAVKPAT